MRILVVYLICVAIGQSVSVALGLALDAYSPSLALATFIVVYFAMYWVAWRVALFIVDRGPHAESGGASAA